MKKIFQESCKYRNILFERAGTWNHHSLTEKDINADSVRKIYNFARKTIIDNINERNSVGGVGNVIKFAVPDKLRKTDNKTLKRLFIRYIIDSPVDAVKMNLAPVDSENPDGDLILTIRVDIFQNDFKILFYHEMQHYFQLSFGFYSFQDLTVFSIAKQNEYNIDKNSTAKVKKLANLVYRLNPQESDAYKEQVYEKAYISFLTDSTREYADSVVRDISDDYTRSDSEFKQILKDVLSDEELKKYVLILFITNFDEIVGKKHGYILFKKQQYDSRLLTDYRKELEKNEIKERSGYDLTSPQKYADFVYEQIKDNDEFIKSVLSVFCRRLCYYRNKVRNKIRNVISAAYFDVAETESVDFLKIADDYLTNFVISEDNGKMSVEIEVLNYETDENWIYRLTDISLFKIFDKFYILNCVVEDDYEISFGFDSVLSSSFETYISKLSKERIKNLEDIAESYQDYDDDISQLIEKL